MNDTQVTAPVDLSYNRRSVILFPEQEAIVDRLATDMAETPGRENFSQALRRIINEWAQDRQAAPKR